MTSQLLAYRLAGNAGLAHMRDDRQPEERTTAPAESVIGSLLQSVAQVDGWGGEEFPYQR